MLKAALFPLLLVATSAANDNPPSDEHNYLSHVATHCEEVEKPFFESLLRAGGHEQLLRSLGVILSATKLRARGWQITEEGMGPEHTFLHRKYLAWQRSFGDDEHLRRVLIFDPGDKSWTGSQYITIVLTDPRYGVLSWRTAGGEPIFKGAELIPVADHHRLIVSWRDRRGRGILKGDYRVTNNAVYLYDDPSTDLPHQEKPE